MLSVALVGVSTAMAWRKWHANCCNGRLVCIARGERAVVDGSTRTLSAPIDRRKSKITRVQTPDNARSEGISRVRRSSWCEFDVRIAIRTTRCKTTRIKKILCNFTSQRIRARSNAKFIRERQGKAPRCRKRKLINCCDAWICEHGWCARLAPATQQCRSCSIFGTPVRLHAPKSRRHAQRSPCRIARRNVLVSDDGVLTFLETRRDHESSTPSRI